MVLYGSLLKYFLNEFIFQNVCKASLSVSIISKRAPVRENLSSGVANNTGADQPAHPRSLISAFVICVLESFIFKLATGEISIF